MNKNTGLLKNEQEDWTLPKRVLVFQAEDENNGVHPGCELKQKIFVRLRRYGELWRFSLFEELLKYQ
jgi:hypothetical protein